MLAISFFTLIFSSFLWLIYAIAFIKDTLGEVSVFDAGMTNILLYILLICLPIFLIWAVFGYVNQYINNRNVNFQIKKLLLQMKRNQDYSDLLARALIETEANVKSGFVLSKFDLLITDMNELLSEIIRNCKLASAEQIENLWSRVQNGGKWAFGKVVIENNNSQPNFRKKVFEKAAYDNILGGTIMEFCARYVSVITILEKHDHEKIFLNMIENGVMGKVFSILAPVSDEIRKGRDVAQTFAEEDDDEVFLPQKPIHTAKRPVQKQKSEKKTFFNKITSFKNNKTNKSDAIMPSQIPDPFSIALEKSFGDEEPILDPPSFFSEPEDDENLPILDAVEEESTPVLTDTQKTLDNLKKEWAELDNTESTSFVAENDRTDEADESFVYPFGNWTNENNYQKKS